MNYAESISYIMNIPRFSKTNTLERMREILSALNNPERDIRYIHIAGTNGKGSTTTMLSGVLRESGYKVGTFTSPFVYDFLERIQINCEPVPRETFAKALTRVRQICEIHKIEANFFEILTVTAILIFSEQKCDFAVLEVGLGGRLDATNIIPPPEIAIITTLALDHTAYLGDTIEQIAAEKSGIIKNGSEVITPCNQAACEVIEKTCQEKGASLFYAAGGFEIISESMMRTELIYKNEKIELPLVGRHQLTNLSLVITAAERLGIDTNTIARGVKRARFPARLEIIENAPLTIVDGAHNPSGMQALSNSVFNLLKGRRVITIFGCMSDKNSAEMVRIAEQFSDILILTKPSTQRASKPSDLAQYCNGIVSENLSDALSKAREHLTEDDVLLICGSLYLPGEIRGLLI